ncbi:oligomeric, coiled-coil, peripheral membrane protein [Tulasnella sp. 331]|nr:oligomeric, coiled-coil, peripheral membrane protein [Tulasnella sp. 331]
MRIIRAEDGEIFDINATFIDIEQSKSLKAFLSNVTGVDENGLICFTSDGMQLRQESLREMEGSEDQSVFVFSREYLDMPVEHVLHELAVAPQFQPEVDTDEQHTSPSSIISAYSRAANFHYQNLMIQSNSIHAQSDSLAVASKNLDVHVLSLTSAYENFAASAQRELEKQEEVLHGHALDMDVISRVKVHAEFLSPAVRRAVEMGGKERHLGDYVSAHKMQMVAESCGKLHVDLVARFNSTRTVMTDLASGADHVRLAASNTFAVDVETCLHRAKDLSERITRAPYDAPIRELDAALRDEVRTMADLKNRSTAHSIDVLRHVSRLQSTLADLPPVLTSLDADLRPKAGFPHLQRLHNMLYVYGATVVEIVRRKEFAKIFMERAQTIAEMMAKLTANERKRRQVYRSEVHGQLPFEARGMDEPAPSLEISTSGSKEATFILTREDLIEFLALVDEISESRVMEESETQSAVIHPVKEVRAALGKLVSRIDTLEADFDRLAEKSTTNEASESAYREVAEQLQDKMEQERILREDREVFETENHRLRADLTAAISDRDREAHEASSRLERIEAFEEEVQTLRDQVASETAARRSLEQRHSDSLAEVVSQASLLEEALVDATEKTKVAGLLKVELQRAKEDLHAATTRHQESDDRVTALLAIQSETLRAMEDARSRGADLEEQIRIAREEGEQATHALKEAALEKETLLRTQANEADRLLRDQIAEANGDRAVLEHQFSEARAELDRRSQEVEELKLELKIQQISSLSALSSSFTPSRSPVNAIGPPPTVLPQPIVDPSNPELALGALAAFDLDAFAETVNKAGSTIRKWQKQCKEYRERARGKITYRNFAKGDLALFLPTRNAVAKPWAAFNVSFPHYFLRAEGHLAEQLKTREWVVARIASIAERVVDYKPLPPPALNLDSTTDEERTSSRPHTPLKSEAQQGELEKEKPTLIRSPFVPLLDPLPASPSPPTSPSSASPAKRLLEGPGRRPSSIVLPSSGSQGSGVNGKSKAAALSSSPQTPANAMPEDPSASSRSRPRLISSTMSTTLSVPFRGPTAVARKGVPAKSMTIPGAFVADDSSSPASGSVGTSVGGAGLLASPALSSSPSKRSNLSYDSSSDVSKVKAAPTTAVISDTHDLLRAIGQESQWQKQASPSPLSASPIRGDRLSAMPIRNTSPLKRGGSDPAQLSDTPEGGWDRGDSDEGHNVQGPDSRTPYRLSGKPAKVNTPAVTPPSPTSEEDAGTELNLAEAQEQTIGRSRGVVAALSVTGTGSNSNASSSGVPSPAGSATEGLSSVLLGLGGASTSKQREKERVTSASAAGSKSTWSNWTNWGASLGRRSSSSRQGQSPAGTPGSTSSGVQDRLRRYDSPGQASAT